MIFDIVIVDVLDMNKLVSGFGRVDGGRIWHSTK